MQLKNSKSKRMGNTSSAIVPSSSLYPTIPKYSQPALKRRIVAEKMAPFGTIVDLQLFKQDAVECPICFNKYSLVNNTVHNCITQRCCGQPICSDCFLQFAREEKRDWNEVECPYCCGIGFGIVYM